ncbi:protein ANTAGONIST OF LIKE HETEROCHROMATIN PROTEIN 1-like [Anopheles arabiensis]|uniref:protein ANTAGONIST OF LIKE HETEROCHROMATIN PROTEIN 1-like n=1 Tax=Anopheles arabiensis TaxID=7173 RepID=UPI001AAC951D|nr:protein ANTAGONIST OF LIKE HETEROCHROMATIN PROTEIN 1-like [Anopheles arabiensis]
MRNAISARERLIITLRFLATGDNYRSLEYTFNVSAQTISTFIPEVCDALIEVLGSYVQLPSNQCEWLKISNDFKQQYGFPNAIGAIDGKHVQVKCPRESGSDYINYKIFFSIVLLAVVDANGYYA